MIVFRELDNACTFERRARASLSMWERGEIERHFVWGRKGRGKRCNNVYLTCKAISGATSNGSNRIDEQREGERERADQEKVRAVCCCRE